MLLKTVFFSYWMLADIQIIGIYESCALEVEDVGFGGMRVRMSMDLDLGNKVRMCNE